MVTRVILSRELTQKQIQGVFVKPKAMELALTTCSEFLQSDLSSPAKYVAKPKHIWTGIVTSEASEAASSWGLAARF